MLKHLLVGAVGLSSLALADGRTHQAGPVAMPPPPVATVATYPLPPPPPVMVNAPPPVVLPAVRDDDRREDRNDRLDVFAARALLREYDVAVASNDFRALRRLDFRLAAFLNDELAEARFQERGRQSRREAERVMELQRQLSRLQGRVDRFALMQKRSVFTQAIDLAERDLRNNRFDDRDDFGHGRRSPPNGHR